MDILEYRRDLGFGLLTELNAELSRGGHVALLGPRGAGKGLVLCELRHRAVERARRFGGRVIDLPISRLRLRSAGALVAEIARQAGVSAEPIRDADPIALPVEQILRAAAGDAPGGVTVFVNNLLRLPTHIVRGLLGAFHACSDYPETSHRLSVLVTGNDNFIHLTYSANSPYRHAKKFILLGLDPTTTARYVRSVRFGRPLEEIFEEGFPSPDESLDHEALELLHSETGGYFHLIQEIVSSAWRYAGSVRGRPEGPWNSAFVKELIDAFESHSLAVDARLWFALHTAEQSPEDFDLLRKIQMEGSVPIPPPDPLSARAVRSPEVSGLLRRDDGHQIRIASPLLLRYLDAFFDDHYIADILALQRRWDDAWEIYERLPPLQRDRPCTGEAEIRLQAVIREWEDTFIGLSNTPDGVDRVAAHFIRGARNLLGYERIGLYDRATTPWSALPQSPGATPPQTPPLHIERRLGSEHGAARGDALTYVDEVTRLEAWSFPVQELASDRKRKPALVLGRLGTERAIDVEQAKVLRRVLDRFWHAWIVADRARFDRQLGELRERHLEVIQKVNDLLLHDDITTARILDGAAAALVDTGRYRRVQFCLVDGVGRNIQAVCTDAAPRFSPINFPTNLSLTDDVPPDRWDVQRWVCHYKRPKPIADASDPTQSDPTTQTAYCRDLGMKGLVVIPLIVQGVVLGTLHLEKIDGARPTDAEVELGEVLAGQIASALHLCKRMTFLKRSLDLLPGRVRIIDPCRRIIFRNRAEAESRSADKGWKGPDKSTDSSCPCEGCERSEFLAGRCQIDELALVPERSENRLYQMPSDTHRAFDWTLASIDDDRRRTPGSEILPDPRIGYIDYRFDISELFGLYAALNHWLAARGTEETARRIVEHFEHLNFQWCRLYMIEERIGRRYLTCLDQRGLTDPANIRKFVRGRLPYSVDSPNSDLTWPLFEGMPGLLIFHQNTTLEPYCHRARDSEQGFQEFDIHEPAHIRAQMEKESEDSWIEAPLRSGERVIGLLSLSRPRQITPRQWGVLQWTVLGVSVALDSAVRAEREVELERHETLHKLCNRAHHQLVNILENPDSVLKRMRHDEESLPERWHKPLRSAHEFVQRSLDILQDLKRYATDHPFADRKRHPLPALMERLHAALRSRYYSVKDIDLSGGTPDVAVDVSESAMLEVLDTLMQNSLVHSDRDPGNLTITLKADRVKGPDHPECDPQGLNVRIAFQDNGQGVAADLKTRIFDPLFTTSTRNSGLGLTIARDFVERNGGWIREEGAHGGPDSHALFSIVLPIATDRQSRG